MNLGEGEDDVSVVSIEVGLVSQYVLKKLFYVGNLHYVRWYQMLCQMSQDVILDELDVILDGNLHYVGNSSMLETYIVLNTFFQFFSNCQADGVASR